MIVFYSRHVRKSSLFLLLFLLLPSIVNAKNYHQKIDYAQAVTNIDLSYDHNNKQTLLALSTPAGITQFTLQENTKLLGNTALPMEEMAVYKGQIIGNPASWARFTSVNGVITGAFFDGINLVMLEDVASVSDTLSANALDSVNTAALDSASPSVLIDASKLFQEGMCGLHDHADVERFGYIEYIAELQDLTQAMTVRQIEISLIADVEYVNKSANATADMISDLNFADGIFSEQLSIQLILSDTTELTNNGTLTSTNAETLVYALRNSTFPNPGLRHLFTGKNLDGSTVGIAFVNSLCRSNSVGVTQRMGGSTGIIFAHELGHNFGSPHDSQSGSACASTGGGFIMFPSVNNNATAFSSCSLSQMLPVIDNATSGYNACVTQVEISSSPVISSTPNVNATVGSAYKYDSDSQLDVTDTTSFTVNLDIAPDGMTIDEAGNIAWVPNASQVGINAVQISVSNAFGSDSQFFEIVVDQPPTSQPPASDVIDFSQVSFVSHDNQDVWGGANVGDSSAELILNGNTWKSIPFNYDVSDSTVLEFEFYSDVKAEIQGIGFDTDNRISPAETFNVFGSQRWGKRSFSYDTQGAYQLIRIPVGALFQGSFDRLVFVLDNDANLSNANARFRNVRVFDPVAVEPDPDLDPRPDPTPAPNDFLDLSPLNFMPHSSSQDKTGTVTLTDNGYGVELVGNRWQKVILNGKSITPDTVISFEFKSTAKGDIHGIGFLPGESINSQFAFQLFGTQKWGIRQFTYTEDGEFQTFEIPVGQFFTQLEVEMVFIMDHDVGNPTGVSHFRNIRLFEASN
jgi:hypothetical protein